MVSNKELERSIKYSLDVLDSESAASHIVQ